MFEDLARNLETPARLGMTTVLVVPGMGTQDIVREDWKCRGGDAPHVHHVTDDLTGFLGRLVDVGLGRASELSQSPPA